MANFLVNNLFRIAVCTLNFVSPSIVADILLHPFDFATVLLQIGFNPEGARCQPTTVFSVILQYALFTFYIPYLLTTMQDLQPMGMPHPSIFYYVGHIYKKEGILGCYRGIVPKLCERILMLAINENVRKRISKGSLGSPDDVEVNMDNDAFLTSLMNTICSHFFAVLISHPFHVLVVSSFAEFTCGRKSSFSQLLKSIYADEGVFGFTTGLTARLLGEILSLMFSVTYTTVINAQLMPQRPVLEAQTNAQTATNFVNYVTDKSRFTALKPRENRLQQSRSERAESERRVSRSRTRSRPQLHVYLYNFLRSLTQNSFLSNRRIRPSPASTYVPLTSRIFYYIMLRDFLSKKISTPFFLVCHCSIVLDTGWEKFPLSGWVATMAKALQKHVVFEKKGRPTRCKFGKPDGT